MKRKEEKKTDKQREEGIFSDILKHKVFFTQNC